MKNVTITLPEEVAKWAKVWAARHETSMARLLGELLIQKMKEEEGYEAAMHNYLNRGPSILRNENKPYPSREELYDRKRLR